MLDLLVLAVALAMDATAAAASLGAGERSLRPVFLGATLFGLAQAGMSALGWWGGEQAGPWTAAWDHWLAFGLLLLVGGKTLREGLQHEEGAERGERGLGPLLVLALATSLDAAAAGVTLPMLPVPGFVSVAVIGGVTLVLSAMGGVLGRRLGDRFGPKLDVLGGVVLIGLGFKILVEHLSAE
jgi:putative Mn2+ efflux pump MntP